jgi:Arc/MetJ-type ribon-helix-helix transcriptional regulator
MKLKKTVAIDKDIYDWVMQKVKLKEYASLSHAIQKALLDLKLKEEKDALSKAGKTN